MHAKRQDGDRRSWLSDGEAVSDQPRRGRVRAEREDPHGTDEVAERELAEIDDSDTKAAAHLLDSGAGQDDSTGLGVGLEARSHVHAVAVDVVVLDDDVGDVDCHPEQDAPLNGLLGGDGGHRLLEVVRALGGIARAVKDRDETVASVLDNAASVRVNPRLQRLCTESHQPGVGVLLVSLHQPAVADPIGDQDRSKAALRTREQCHGAGLSRAGRPWSDGE
jgi:hypothetical protein